MAASTAMEALTAELLGDVGLLHDEVKKLREAIPTLSAEAEAQLAPVVGMVVQATEALKVECINIIKTARADLGATQQEQAASLQAYASDLQKWLAENVAAKVSQDAGEEVNKAIAAQAQAILNDMGKIKDDAEKIVQKSRRSFTDKVVVLMLIAAIGGFCGGLGYQAGTKYFFAGTSLSAADAQLIKQGKALRDAWPKLDEKTRKRITDAANIE